MEQKRTKKEEKGHGLANQVPVVGIGASAGGLEALQQFFYHMSANSGLGFVVIQHLSPDYKSLMADILGKYTPMAVIQAENNMAVEANKVIEIRGLKIDTTARRVWVNEEERTFTTKEFDLLTFLASHPNHVYTKEELFREIWDMESIGDIATVTVHIKKIREKVEMDTSNPQYIETIWGVGYRFKV